MEEIAVEINSETGICLPGVHDGNLVSIENISGDLAFSIKSDGSVYKLVARQVYRSVINNFREGNVLLDVVVVHGRHVPRQFLEPLCTNGDKLDQRALDMLIDFAKLNNMVVIEVNSSYGCHAVVICRRLQMYKI